MKQWLTAKEISEQRLPGLPESKSGVLRHAKLHHWECQATSSNGGVSYEFHISNLSKQAREVLQEQHRLAVLKKMTLRATSLQGNNLLTLPASKAKTTQRQRDTASSRAMVLRAIQAMVEEGISQESAIATILTQAQLGSLAQTNPVLEKALMASVDPRGHGQRQIAHSCDDVAARHCYPSKRSIMRWFSELKQQGDLIPKQREKAPLPKWLAAFRQYYNVPEKPSLNGAYELFRENWFGDGPCPSIYAVRRAMDKLGKVEREKGRMGSHDLVNIRPFTRRRFDHLLPCDIYSADGHTFDGEVSHPLHGRPFRPEITTFIDIATRRVVGVSVTLAESGMAVLDALMDACKCGVPALIYVDNGSGYVNHMLKDEAKGILARLGSEMTHSIPYNSKARGVIERVHQTLWVAGAKTLPNYVGKDMDRQARLANFKASRQGAQSDGPISTLSWSDFMAWVDGRIEWYNKRPHNSLPKIDDQGTKRHQTPLEVWMDKVATGWEPLVLNNDEIAHVFRPREERTVVRGEVRLFNNRYFSPELEEFHGLNVHVAYDIHDPNRVWVFDMITGELIAHADWNANESKYYPDSVLNQAREKRAQGRLNRAMKRVDEIEAERRGNGVFDRPGAIEQNRSDLFAQLDQAVFQPQAIAQKTALQPPVNQYESLSPAGRFALYQECQHNQDGASQHQVWMKTYPLTKEFKYFRSFDEQKPLSQEDGTHEKEKYS
ncbi:Mu transposase C-terminal domain-containing protein [Marinomonas transparens]|uniref:Transposase n=1 Tax=Marinomonas transparens TaxID=2795388 RepID=A0A934JP61_9GAMM|nr:Mu transposase C-terminal domain-containing protein [Marinomonas transparens]MBJ7537183.1 transposase [Marinomonas transparens]